VSGKGAIVISTVLICSSTTGCLHRQPKVTQAPPLPQPTESASAPPAPKTRTRKNTTAQQRRKPQATVVPTPSAAETSASPPSASALGEILSPKETEDLTRALNQSLSSARQNVSLASKRPLTSDQQQTVKLVLAFVSQAEQARQSDLSLATQLAHRAEVLADSLKSPGQ
jgi:hypothetical protein